MARVQLQQKRKKKELQIESIIFIPSFFLFSFLTPSPTQYEKIEKYFEPDCNRVLAITLGYFCLYSIISSS